MLKDESSKRPAIVLIPGLDGTALLFYRQIPLLEKRFQVLTFPLPDDSSSTMESLVSQLLELVRESTNGGPGRVFLCGESFGGALSLSFALSHPEWLAGTVIVNSFPVIRQRIRLRLAPPLLKALPWGTMRLVRRFTEARLHSPHARPEDLREFHQRTRAIGRRGYIRRLEIIQKYNIEDCLGDIQTPTLFLAGDRDHLVPSLKEAHLMASRMPHATVNTLRCYGHICLINHDLNLLDYIDPWLARIADGVPS